MNSTDASARGRLLVVVCLTALAVLSYEIALTRVFSVLFRSPFVFLILSIAICGLGLGSFLAAWPPGRSERNNDLVAPAVAFAALLPLPVILLLTVARDLVASANPTGLALLTLLPYTAAGLLLSRAFRIRPDDAGRLYFADLAGAGLAAAVTTPLLARIGGLATPLAIGALAAVGAAVAAGERPRWRLAAVGLGVLWTAGFVLQLQLGWLRLPPVTLAPSDPRAAWAKPLFQELGDPAAGAEVQYTEWSAVARTDVVSNVGTDTLYIWTDGDVPTQMEPFDGDLASVEHFRGFIGYLPFTVKPNARGVMCIGPGGGLDVLLALLGGATDIEPVELNPAIVRVVDKFKGFYGDLYNRPEVSSGLIIDEGRSFLARSPRRYDMIYFALAKSATTQQGGMALIDNYLYTTEAFAAYLDHLTDDGLVALVLQAPHLTDRCLITAVTTMAARGLSGDQIGDRVAYLSARPGMMPGPYQQLLLIRAQPFAPEQAAMLRAEAEARGIDPVWLPHQVEAPPYLTLRHPSFTPEALTAAITGQDKYLTRLYRGGPLERLNLSAVTDDRPFYADLSSGLHPLLRSLLRGSLWAGLVALLLAVAWAMRVTAAPTLAEATVAGTTFALLGAAFMLVEISLIQRLVLLLGYPTLSLTVILFTLLLGSAVGGRLVSRGDVLAASRRLPWAGALLLAVILLAAWGLTTLSERFLAASLPLRVLVTVLVTFPLGVLMGHPFPTALRWLGLGRDNWVPLAWAVNGVWSVAGSVLAASTASVLGYRAVMLVGFGLYLAVLLVMAVWSRLLPVTLHSREGAVAPTEATDRTSEDGGRTAPEMT